MHFGPGKLDSFPDSIASAGTSMVRRRSGDEPYSKRVKPRLNLLFSIGSHLSFSVVINRNAVYLVAWGLRILPDFAGFCRAKCWNFFVFRVRRRTLNQ